MKSAAILLLAALVFSCPINGQALRDQTDSISVATRDTVYGFPSYALAITFCDSRGNVRSWVDMAVAPDTLQLIKVHEAVHRQQEAHYPNCKSWEDAITHNVALSAQYEVEGYCASLKQGHAMGMDMELLRTDYINKVYRQFGGLIPVASVSALYSQTCPLEMQWGSP